MSESKKESQFSVEDLRAHSVELFGVEAHVFDGAFHGRDGKFTKAAAKKIVTDFLKKEVS